MAVLGYLEKLKRDLGLPFGAHFQHDFSTKMFLIEHSINGQSFHVTPYFFLIISNKMCCFSLDRWWHNKLRFFLNQPVKQWLAGRKRGEDKNTQIWISQERKELFRWNKKHFSKFLKDYHLVKNTQALIKLNNIH